MSRLPHPRPALNDTFSIATAAGLPRQVKQGKRQRSDTRKQSVNLWRRATPLLRATGERDPPPARRRLALEAWTPQLVPLLGLRPSREREGVPETGAGREVGPACGKVRRKPNRAPAAPQRPRSLPLPRRSSPE